MTDVASIIVALECARFSVSNEKQLQADIHDVLVAAGINCNREHRLSRNDIIDFFAGGVGIEVKIKGGRRDIARQLRRYSEHQEIKAIILVGTVVMGLPSEMNGKPVHSVSIGRAWL